MTSQELSAEQDALLRKHLPFVRHLAKKIAAKMPASVDIEDLEAAGNIGLLQAVRSFDKSLGNTFLTYCKHRVRGSMMDEIRGMDWIGRTYRAREDDLPSMNNFSGFSPNEEGSINPIEPMDTGVTAERRADAAEMVTWFLDRLCARDARVIWAYHGPENMTYNEIAEELGLSESRVCNIYKRAVIRMKTLAEKLRHDPI